MLVSLPAMVFVTWFVFSRLEKKPTYMTSTDAASCQVGGQLAV